MTRFDRRQVLGLLAALSAVAATPGCGNSGSSAPARPGAFLSDAELAFVSAVADTMIPAGQTPGALVAKVPDTIQSLLTTWASAETRSAWRGVLEQMKATLDTAAGGAFATADAAKREQALTALDAEIYNTAEHALAGWKPMKQAFAQAYYHSEPGATIELAYEPNPGDWKANIPLSDIGRAWAV